MIKHFVTNQILRKAASLTGHSSAANQLINIGKTYINRRRDDNLTEPTLQDYELKAATYMRDINFVFGKIKLHGNVIWSTCANATQYLRVSKTKSNKVRTYQGYKASFAIAFCCGPVDKIGKIYFNDEEVAEELYEIRRYNGTNDQLPDKVIESHLGKNQTPGFRGLCYIVVHDVDLAEFKFKIPTVSCIIHNDLSKINNIICGNYALDKSLVSGMIINSKFEIHLIARLLGLTVTLKEGVKNYVNKNHNKIFNIDSSQIIPIDNAPYIMEHTNEKQQSIKINYLDAHTYKVKSYMPFHSANDKIVNIDLAFAIHDYKVKDIYKSILIEDETLIIQTSAEPKICIGSYINILDGNLGLFHVTQLIYTNLNTKILILNR